MQLLVIFDVAARQLDPAPKVLPDHIEPLLLSQKKPDVCPIKVKQWVEKVRKKFTEEAIFQAKQDIEKYLTAGRFTDILNGHLLFGVIRKVFTCITNQHRKKKAIVSDDALIQLLADMVWREVPSQEHFRLRSKIRSVVRE